MRNGKDGTHRPKAASGLDSRRTLEEAGKVFERVSKLIDRADDYLEAELERAVKEEGKSAEAIRIRKHLWEVREAAKRELLAGDHASAGSAGAGGDFLRAGLDG